MPLPNFYELATDALFRELSNFITPPRAGKVTALEGNGQVRVATDDPDGGDVLAWPLNGFTYAVEDVVYVMLALNNPETGVVIGSKGSVPRLDAAVIPPLPYVPVDGSDNLTADSDIGEDRKIKAEALRARDGEGLRLETDEGTGRVFFRDDGMLTVGVDEDGGGLFNVRDVPLGSYGFEVESDSAGRGWQAITADYEFGVQGSVATFQFTGGSGDQHAKLNAYGGGKGSVADLILQDLSGGNVGIRTAFPQGHLHVAGATGGMAYMVKTGITNTAQTIIPNASGDITQAVIALFVLSSGGSSTANTFTLAQAGTTTLDISVGGSTYRITLNANGALTVARTVGSGSGTLALLMLWI